MDQPVKQPLMPARKSSRAYRHTTTHHRPTPLDNKVWEAMCKRFPYFTEGIK